MHTFRLKAGANEGASLYEVGYQANDPNAGDPSKFTVQSISNHPVDAKNAVHSLNKSNTGEGHP